MNYKIITILSIILLGCGEAVTGCWEKNAFRMALVRADWSVT